MRGRHPTFHQLLSNLKEKVSEMDQEKAYKVVRKALSDWKMAEGLIYKSKPGRPAGIAKRQRVKTLIYKAAKEIYQEKGIFPTIAEIRARLDEPISISVLKYNCGQMKDLADAIGAPYPKNRTDQKHIEELYKGNDPISVLLKDLYQAALTHPEINYVSGLTESNYTKYSSTAYRRHIGDAQQIADLLYMKYGIKIQIRKPRQRKAA